MALEEPIDPKEYRLGPADLLNFKVWGNIEIEAIIRVGPDGKISIPTIGEFKVSGMTVFQADSLIKRKSLKSYENSTTSLSVIQLRMHKVLISGAVNLPGVFELSSIDRLSTLIAYADGFIEEEPENLEIDNPRSGKGKSSQSKVDDDDDDFIPGFEGVALAGVMGAIAMGTLKKRKR